MYENNYCMARGYILTMYCVGFVYNDKDLDDLQEVVDYHRNRIKKQNSMNGS